MSAGSAGPMERALVVATSNPGKVRELASLLPSGVRLYSLAELLLDSPEETGQSFLDNALLKAEHASMSTSLPAIADDSGLEVTALGSLPGVRSARYAGPDASDVDNNRKLIDELSAIAARDRSARFVCAVALCVPGGLTLTACGSVAGTIVDEPRGSHGFGYDPHFEIDESDLTDYNGRTMAELRLDEKNKVSHRSRAYRTLLNEARRDAAAYPALDILFRE